MKENKKHVTLKVLCLAVPFKQPTAADLGPERGTCNPSILPLLVVGNP